MRLVQVAPVYVPPVMPAMRVRMTLDQIIPDNVYYLVNLDLIDYDTQGDFDTVNHKWVCSIAGRYLVSINLFYISMLADKLVRGIIFVNGVGSTPYYILSTAINGHFVHSASDILSFTVADEVELFARHNAGTGMPIRAGGAFATCMSIIRLG